MDDLFAEISKNLSAKNVGIEEFCESSDFCDKHLYPRQLLLLKLIFLEELSGKDEDVLNYWIKGGRTGKEVMISPMIRERVDYLRSLNYPHFREVVLVGGRRSSKGFVTGLAMAKKMYDTLQLRDPGLHYGIDQDKEIYFSCIASSQDQAKKYQYADFSSTVARCKGFDDNLTKLQELEFSVATDQDKIMMQRFKRQGGRGRDISKLRGVALAANASAVRGSATMAVCFDEMAHMQQEGESAQTAAAVYEALTPSLAQFGKAAMIFCNSSPYTKVGKFFERYNDGIKLTDKNRPAAPMTLTFQFPSWALFEGYQGHKSKFHSRPFKRAITVSPDWIPEETVKSPDGTEYQHSAEDKDNILIEQDNERQDDDTYKVERRGEFAEVVDAFLRPEMVDQAYLGVPTRDGMFLPLKTNWTNPSFQYEYKAHLDPSNTTAGFGFAMGHIEQFEHEDTIKDHVVMDVIHRWLPEQFPERVVDWEIVLGDIVRWVDLFQPYEVTFDQFQSSAPMQWLNKWLRENNMSSIRVYEKTATAQYNWNRANVFRTALYQGLVHLPSDTAAAEWSALELKHLQQINTAGRFPRIDKQEIGFVQTKDMADCIMEVTDSLIGNVVNNETRSNLASLTPAMGAKGGYQIGGRDGRLDTYYSNNQPGSHTFREQRKGNVAGNEGTSAAERVREQLGGLTASRGGSWSARPRRGGGSGRRGRGY
jgi:hypothetical protein